MADSRVIKYNTPLNPRDMEIVEAYTGECNYNKAATARFLGMQNASVARYLNKPNVKRALKTKAINAENAVKYTPNNIIDKLWEEAKYFGEGATHNARITALVHLGKHIGMFQPKEVSKAEAKDSNKVQINVLNYKTDSPANQKRSVVEDVKEALEHIPSVEVNTQLEQLEVTSYED